MQFKNLRKKKENKGRVCSFQNTCEVRVKKSAYKPEKKFPAKISSNFLLEIGNLQNNGENYKRRTYAISEQKQINKQTTTRLCFRQKTLVLLGKKFYQNEKIALFLFIKKKIRQMARDFL